MVESDADRGYLLAALATYRETTAGRYHHLESRVDGEPDLLVPYVTRFNSSRRVAEAAERFEGAFDRAAREFDDAVVVTLTTDPSRFDSLLDAAGSLTEDVNRFKSWLATEGRLGYRPPSVVVPEFTESGLPHVHVVLFGVSWVVSHEVLSAYWSGRRGRAEVVWFDRLVSRGVGGRWRWADGGPSDVEGRSPRSYLSKGLGVAAEFAAASPEEVREASQALRAVVEGEDTAECPESLSGSESARDDERGRTSRGRGTVGGGVVGDETGTEGEASSALARGRRWWRLALYYATDLRWFTASPSLTGADDDEGEEGEGECLPYVSRYRYVGTARYSEFPGYVRARARVCRYDRPPPSGSSHVSARGP